MTNTVIYQFPECKRHSFGGASEKLKVENNQLVRYRRRICRNCMIQVDDKRIIIRG